MTRRWLDPEARRSQVRALVAAETVGDATIGQALSGLCRALVSRLQVAGAVVNMISRAGGDVVLAASHDESRRVGQLYYDIGEGPGHDAFARGRPVLVSDLAREGAAWPGYAAAARDLGVGAVFAFPLQVGAARFGLLTAYAAQPRPLDGDDAALCLSFAQLATEMLIDGPAAELDGHLAPDMVRSMDFRSVVYQAQGMVSVSLGLQLDDALALLRARLLARPGARRPRRRRRRGPGPPHTRRPTGAESPIHRQLRNRQT